MIRFLRHSINAYLLYITISITFETLFLTKTLYCPAKSSHLRGAIGIGKGATVDTVSKLGETTVSLGTSPCFTSFFLINISSVRQYLLLQGDAENDG